jgi:hypothetical protein
MRFVLTSVALAGFSLCLAFGCGGDDTADGAASGTPGGPGGTTSGGLSCEPTAACTAVESDCIALVDNAGQDVVGLRVQYLKLVSPPALANGPVTTVITKGIELNREECSLVGQGTFSWILEFTKSTGMLKTGGAKVSTPEEGYCFVNETLSGVDIAPIEVDVGLDGGQISPTMGQDVTVPIYIDATGSSYVLLPLRQARIFDGKLSEDGNCIGTYNAANLSPDDACVGNADTPPFLPGAKIDGFITLEEADGVVVEDLGQSLCVLLSGDAATYGDGGDPVNRCKRDGMGKIVLEGDWCSTDNMADGCKDAVKLAAEFAASGIKINGDCN